MQNQGIFWFNDYITVMSEQGYLSDNKVKVIKHPDSQYLDEYLDNRVSKITLQVTQSCNLKCKYCPYAYPDKDTQRSHSIKRMTYETAKKAIDYYFDHSNENQEMNIGFYGGEPLLEVDLIKKCIEYVKSRCEGRVVTYSMTSNLTLLNDDIIKLLADNDFYLMVSFDGPKDIHNKNRVFYNNKGSFDIVMKNLHRIMEVRPEYINHITVNSVLDPENNFDCYNDFFTNCDVFEDIRFRAGILNNKNLETSFTQTEQYIFNYKFEKFKYFLYLLGEVDKKDTSPLVETFFTSTSAFVSKLKTRNELPETAHHSGPCMPGARRLFIDTEGDFFPCEKCSETAEIMKIGNLDTGFDKEKAYRLINIGEMTKEECKNCWNLSFCSICAVKVEQKGAFSKELKLKNCNLTSNTTVNNFLDCLLLMEYGFDFSLVKE